MIFKFWLKFIKDRNILPFLKKVVVMVVMGSQSPQNIHNKWDP